MPGGDLGTVLRRCSEGTILEVETNGQTATVEVVTADASATEPAIFEDPYYVVARGASEQYRLGVTPGVVGSVVHIERNVSHSSRSPIWKSLGRVDDLRIAEE